MPFDSDDWSHPPRSLIRSTPLDGKQPLDRSFQSLQAVSRYVAELIPAMVKPRPCLTWPQDLLVEDLVGPRDTMNLVFGSAQRKETRIELAGHSLVGLMGRDGRVWGGARRSLKEWMPN